MKRKCSAFNQSASIENRRLELNEKPQKRKIFDDRDLDLEQGLNLSIAKLDSRLLADYVLQRTKYFESDSSLVELLDKQTPGIWRAQQPVT